MINLPLVFFIIDNKLNGLILVEICKLNPKKKD